MSDNWADDIHGMHLHYGFHEKVRGFGPAMRAVMLDFRIRFLEEEMDELERAAEEEDPEGIVDALIDLCVVAIGTLDLFDVDAGVAWDRVHEANMSKRLGIKESRPNPLGLPDLVKPEGWVAPSHNGNHGTLREVWR